MKCPDCGGSMLYVNSMNHYACVRCSLTSPTREIIDSWKNRAEKAEAELAEYRRAWEELREKYGDYDIYPHGTLEEVMIRLAVNCILKPKEGDT